MVDRASAALAIFAMLLQAIVCAWHHHALSFASRQSPIVASVAAPTSPDAPLSAEHECRICSANAHHGTLPADVFATALPEGEPVKRLRAGSISAALLSYLLFQPRAPPLA
jgi:hypothetical protein